MENLISTFHIDVKLLVAQVINFGIVFGVLYFLGIRPLMRLVKTRSATIQQGLDDANKNKEVLSATEEESARIIASARREASDLITLAKNDAEAKRMQLIEETRADVNNMLEKGKAQLDVEKNKIIQEAHHEITNLVIATSRKVLGEAITPTIDAAFIQKSIDKV